MNETENTDGERPEACRDDGPPADGPDPAIFPDEPIDRVIDPLKRFVHIESASGIVLLVAAAAALAIANSPLAGAFLSFWQTHAAVVVGGFSVDLSLRHWVNDGLMTIFFFVVGLEVKRELVAGELADLRRAMLPVAAAVGGMVVPAGIYLALQHDGAGLDGWGIPMATDIAFVVGIMVILGERVPAGLRVMLLSLAIADDIGAILVIAVGYSPYIRWPALALAAGGVGAVFALFRLGVRNTAVHALGMLFVWAALHESGIHPTLAGVCFGLLTPTRSWIGEGKLGVMAERTLCLIRGKGWSDGAARHDTLRKMERAARKTIPPQERFEKAFHPWSGFLIMPLFALANAGVAVSVSAFTDPVAVAVALGLMLGKPAGVVAASWLAVSTGLARLPRGVGWGALTGAGCLAGIGFTMSLFIAGLALEGPLLDAAKIGILAASFLSAAAGAALLLTLLPKPAGTGEDPGQASPNPWEA